jgi:hypothetical protein
MVIHYRRVCQLLLLHAQPQLPRTGFRGFKEFNKFKGSAGSAFSTTASGLLDLLLCRRALRAAIQLRLYLGSPEAKSNARRVEAEQAVGRKGEGQQEP